MNKSRKGDFYENTEEDGSPIVTPQKDVFGILRALSIKKYKALYNDPNAHVTNAKFVKAKMSSYSSKSVGVGPVNVPTSINVYKKIIYTYTDETGVEHTATSTMSYTPNQVKHLEGWGTFKII